MSKSTLSLLQSLRGRTDVYARQTTKGTWYPVEEPLSNAVLLKHLRHEHTVGTYVVDDGMAHTLVLDFDNGVEPYDAFSARIALEQLGVPRTAIGVEFSGRKGYHLWVVCRSLVSAAGLRRLGRAALALAGVRAEIFPAQDMAKTLGNLIKLPGGVHQVSGKVAEFITPLPQPCTGKALEEVLNALPEEALRVSVGSGSGYQCMVSAQEGPPEKFRNNSLYQIAVQLRRISAHDDVVRYAVYRANALCDEPLPDTEVEKLIESSRTGGPRCDSLPADTQCEDCPFREQKGLSKRPAQLRNGRTGEKIVVEVGMRYPDGSIEILHPDLHAPMRVLVGPKPS